MLIKFLILYSIACHREFLWYNPHKIVWLGNTFPILPNSTTHLTLGNEFKQPVDYLSLSITHLVLGNEFNQPVDGSLPPSITHLTFGNKFNQPVDALPPRITNVTFGK